MKRLFTTGEFVAKLRARLNTCGESIVETLAAVLVCSLAILVMYTAMASASRINAAAESQAAGLRDDVMTVEMQAESVGFNTVSVSGFTETYDVEYYVGENENLVSYRLRY